VYIAGFSRLIFEFFLLRFAKLMITEINSVLTSFMSPPVISHSWNMLRMYAKVVT
jgi:hypothetical protein